MNRNARRDERLGIDPRQRIAAVNVLCAIDLPAPLDDWAKHIQEAARLAPGITMDQIQTGTKRAGLERAREIIDELLAEGGAD